MPMTGNHIIKLETVDSTNVFAQELLQNHKVEDGTVIVSRNQTKGKGQRGSLWIAEPGTNLTFSIIFFPKQLTADKQFLLNKAFSLAVYDFLSNHGLSDISIKWPNDVMIKGKKIAGMLVENSVAGEYIRSIIAGFGINVNQTNFGMSLIDIATSMRLEKATVFKLDELLLELIESIKSRYAQVLKHENKLITQDYTSHLFQLNLWGMYEANGKEFIGCIRGINDTGQLIVEHQGGVKQTFANKEIRYKIF